MNTEVPPEGNKPDNSQPKLRLPPLSEIPSLPTAYDQQKHNRYYPATPFKDDGLIFEWPIDAPERSRKGRGGRKYPQGLPYAFAPDGTHVCGGRIGKTWKRCRAAPLEGHRRCEKHGGTNPGTQKGTRHALKAGRLSKVLPEAVRKHFIEELKDPTDFAKLMALAGAWIEHLFECIANEAKKDKDRDQVVLTQNKAVKEELRWWFSTLIDLKKFERGSSSTQNFNVTADKMSDEELVRLMSTVLKATVSKQRKEKVVRQIRQAETGLITMAEVEA